MEEGTLPLEEEGNLHLEEEGNLHLEEEGNLHLEEEGRLPLGVDMDKHLGSQAVAEGIQEGKAGYQEGGSWEQEVVLHRNSVTPLVEHWGRVGMEGQTF